MFSYENVLFSSFFFLSDFVAYIMFTSAFSDGCESYHGPHPAKCLVSMWKSAGCVEEGYLYPRNLTESHVEKLNNLNLQ